MTLMIVIIRIINISLTNTVKHKHKGREHFIFFQNSCVNLFLLFKTEPNIYITLTLKYFFFETFLSV